MERTKQYWVDKLGEEWAMRLKETLKSPYMDKLMNFLPMQYALQRVHPHEANIFKKLKQIPIEKIRVVILTKEPGINASNFKLPYADSYIDCMHKISYHKIYDCIAKEIVKIVLYICNTIMILIIGKHKELYTYIQVLL